MSLSKDDLQDELLEFVYQAPIGICETDMSGAVLRLNPFLTSLILQINEHHQGRSFPNLLNTLRKFDPTLDRFDEKIASGAKIILENHDIPINRRGLRAIRVKCRRISGNHLIFCIEDISALIEVEDKRRQLEKERANISTIHALAQLAESRDDDTGSHLDRVRSYCRILGESLLDDSDYRDMVDEEFVDTLWHASPLHDIGKVGIPDNILLKPGKLTAVEFEVMKTHTLLGAKTLESVHRDYPENKFIEMGISIARHHHERWDGSGYPDGLSGGDIPLAARIMAIADVYDALRVRRIYKEPFSHEKSCAIITSSGGSHMDPGLLVHFHQLHEAFNHTYNDAVKKRE